MNASEKAQGLEVATKIAVIVQSIYLSLIFPMPKQILNLAWYNDPDTIDIGFHLPGWSPRFQSRSLLVQICFHQDSVDDSQKLVGVDAAALNYQGQIWGLSTVYD